MVKNGGGQSGHETLKMTVSQKLNRWNRLIFCKVFTNSGNLNGPGQKWQRPFSS